MYLSRRSVLFCVMAAAVAPVCNAQAASRLPGELSWTIGSDPRTFDPAQVDDEWSELVRYLTAGTLVRFNRLTQTIDPALAESWSESADGKTVTFRLRGGLQFSNGASLTSRDVAWSIRRVLLPATGAPVADEFLSPKSVVVETPNPKTAIIHLPARVIGIGKVFDEIAIEPADHPSDGRVTSGPFVVSEYRRLQYVRLTRNLHYFARDSSGAALPYAPGIRLDILQDPEQKVRLFLRSDYDLIENLPPDYFELLKRKDPSLVRDLGPSLNTEQMWFNQAPSSPLPQWEKSWFQSRAFRVAISQAIHRADLARLAYEGHATPAYTFISPANTAWYDRNIATPHEDVNAARSGLAAAGFHLNGSQLEDASGHPVKFSILTNAGNAARLKMATMIQDDLAALRIKVTVVTLDFPALIERLLHTQNYEACLLGLANVDPDPNAMMNLWISSSPNHQWNPSEKTPATNWEAEIDRLMQRQASTADKKKRKAAIDRVQQIVADEQPFIYLVYPNALVAYSNRLKGVEPAVLAPRLVWNVERLHLQGGQ